MLAFTSSFTSIQSHQGIAFHSSFHLPRIFPEKSRYSFLTIHDEAPGGTYHHEDDYFAREADTFNSDIRRDVKEYSLAATLNVNGNKPNAIDVSVCGHRGAVFAEPENTVKGFRAAINMGCDSFELDVFLLKDGNLVVFHGDGSDKNPGLLHSYCGVQGSILDYDYEEVKKLNLRKECKEIPCDHDKLLGAYIPLLEEVLIEAKKSGIYVKIELKGPGTEVPCLELVEKLKMVDQCSFSSFNHDRVANIRNLRPERKLDGSHRYITGCLFNENVPDNFVEECEAIGATEIHLKYDTCTKERVVAIHDKGLRSMAWFRGPKGMKLDSASKYLDVGNEDNAMYQVLINTGVMIMCVNRPDVLLKLLQNYNRH